MTSNSNTEKPFNFRFIGAPSNVLLELTNVTEKTLKSIEILTVFLKDEETPGGGPSQAHIRFDAVKSMQAKEKAVLSHRTWINGRPADTDHDQLGRLKVIAGEVSPNYFRQRVRGLGLKEVLSAPRSPWQNAYVERLIGSIRRECLDHVIVLNEQHLRRILRSYFAYYHRTRTHLSVDKDAPDTRPVQLPAMGTVIEIAEVGGLHHRYERRAA